MLCPIVFEEDYSIMGILSLLKKPDFTGQFFTGHFCYAQWTSLNALPDVFVDRMHPVFDLTLTKPTV